MALQGGLDLLQQGFGPPGHQIFIIVQPLGPFGNPSKQFLDVSAGGEHLGEALCCARRVPEHTKEPIRLAQVVTEVSKGEQSPIRICALGQPLQNHRQKSTLNCRSARHPLGEGCQVVEGSLGIDETGGPQPQCCLRAGESPSGFIKACHRRE